MSLLLVQGTATRIPLADESIQCIVTSPPYWGLRSYAGGWEQQLLWGSWADFPVSRKHPDRHHIRLRWRAWERGGISRGDSFIGALGLEPNPELYVEHMVEVFREVWRVLRRDGTLWLNLGDSYSTETKWGGATGGKHVAALHGNTGPGRFKQKTGLKPKDLIGMPWRVAFALQADGWLLRSDIVWAKPNPMPESVTDRPTKAHEYVFLLAKSSRYFYDTEAIKSPASPATHARISQASLQEQRGGAKQDAYEAGESGHRRHDRRPNEIVQALGRKPGVNPKAAMNEPGAKQNASFSAAVAGPVLTRNARTVWTIATQPYAGAHFATFPEELPEQCILAGTSPRACGECGAPWRRVLGDPEQLEGRGSGNKKRRIASDASDQGRLNTHMGSSIPWSPTETPTVDWRPTCDHDDDSGRSIVLDPFAGTSAVGRAALRHGRAYVGLDISREYLTEHSLRRTDPIAAARRDLATGAASQGVLEL